MSGVFSISEYFSEYEFRVIHNIEKASAPNWAKSIEYFRLHIEYLWNTVDLKMIEHGDSLVYFSIRPAAFQASGWAET